MYKIDNKFRPVKMRVLSEAVEQVKETAFALKHGESFFVPAKDLSPASLQKYLSQVRSKDRKLSVHKQLDKNNKVTGCYVYRRP